MSFQLSIEQLEAFVVTVETGSFTAAARKLNKAQSSISGLISNLEVETGFELFDRSKNRPSLTRQGSALLHYANAAVAAHRGVLARVMRLNSAIEDDIRLVIDEGAVPHSSLHSLMSAFRERFPQTKLHVYRTSHSQTLNFLRQGNAELAVVSNIEDYGKDLQFRNLGQLQFGVVVAADHELAERTLQGSDELGRYTQLQWVDPFIKDQSSNETLNVQRTNQFETLLEWLQLGLGWAELPLNMVQAELQRKCLRHLTVQTSHMPKLMNVDLLWSRDTEMGHAMGWLIDFLCRENKTLFKL